jgi:hypothetical protein
MGRSASGRPPPVCCRRTAEEYAQEKGLGGTYAAAVAQALTFVPFYRHIFGTASRAATALLRTNTFRGHARVTSRCTANAPCRPLTQTSRVALQAQSLVAANEEVRSLAVRVGLGGGARECTREYQLRANHPPRGRILGAFFVSENNFRAFPAVKQNCAERPKIGCAQLAAIERDAATAALVADVTAKNLDASTGDLLLSVKVRCRRCAPLSVLGCRSTPRSGTLAGVLEYPWSPTSTHAARTSTADCAGVLHSVVECA